MVLRLIARSPRGPGFLAPVARKIVLANLVPASGHQDHTPLPSAVTALVRRSIRVHRIPASRPVTIGQNALCKSRRDARSIIPIFGICQGRFFGGVGARRAVVECPREFRFSARGNLGSGTLGSSAAARPVGDSNAGCRSVCPVSRNTAGPRRDGAQRDVICLLLRVCRTLQQVRRRLRVFLLQGARWQASARNVAGRRGARGLATLTTDDCSRGAHRGTDFRRVDTRSHGIQSGIVRSSCSIAGWTTGAWRSTSHRSRGGASANLPSRRSTAHGCAPHASRTRTATEATAVPAATGERISERQFCDHHGKSQTSRTANHHGTFLID
jgi:hypothetical protein